MLHGIELRIPYKSLHATPFMILGICSVFEQNNQYYLRFMELSSEIPYKSLEAYSHRFEEHVIWT
jgi:hypothetical protein